MVICKSGAEMLSFQEINSQRERLGITQKRLCRVADVSEHSFSRAKSTGKEPTPRIRRRLSVALDSIASERGVKFVEETGAKS